MLARDTLKRLTHDETSARKKVTEVLSLLCTTAQQVQQWAPEEAHANGDGSATDALPTVAGPGPSYGGGSSVGTPSVEPASFLPDLSSLPFDVSEFGGDAFWSALGAGAGSVPFDGQSGFAAPAPSSTAQDQFDVDAWSSFFSNAVPAVAMPSAPLRRPASAT